MPNTKNIQRVENLTDRVNTSTGVVFLDYKGLTHRQLEDLRLAIAEDGGSIEITKNTLMKIALSKHDVEAVRAIDNDLTGPTATLFIGEDIVTPIKKLADFMKKNELPKIKWAIIENQFVDENQVKNISMLPSKEELVARLMGQIKAPLYGLAYVLTANVRNLVYALSAIEKKGGGEANG
ncbi:50S ribosomal protein L10 [candidate division WWE3 bacterium]|nr:50S ribosomal protein L10 [candidate division WWE3 bacterium]